MGRAIKDVGSTGGVKVAQHKRFSVFARARKGGVGVGVGVGPTWCTCLREKARASSEKGSAGWGG